MASNVSEFYNIEPYNFTSTDY